MKKIKKKPKVCNSVKFGVTLPIALDKELKIYAIKDMTTRNKLIRRILTDWVYSN